MWKKLGISFLIKKTPGIGSFWSMSYIFLGLKNWRRSFDSNKFWANEVLTELIRFVRRCSTSWPKSMTDFSLANQKHEEAGYVKELFSRLSLSAARNFYIWAESLAGELEELSRSDLQGQLNPAISDAPNWRISAFEKLLQDTET